MTTNSEKFPQMFDESIKELIYEKKISVVNDIVHKTEACDYTPPTPPTPPTSHLPKKPSKKQQPPKELTKEEITKLVQQMIESQGKGTEDIAPELVKILLQETDAEALGAFMGLSPERINDILYKKTKYTVEDLAPGNLAAVKDNVNLIVSRDQFTRFLNYYKSDKKPVAYWLMIHTFIHELIHLFSFAKFSQDALYIEEAIVPLTEHEFIFANCGGMNPHLIDIDESNLMRYYNKTAEKLRIGYPAQVFYIFDQLIGFSTVYPEKFKTLFRNYFTSTKSIAERISAIESYSASLNYPIEIRMEQQS